MDHPNNLYFRGKNEKGELEWQEIVQSGSTTVTFYKETEDKSKGPVGMHRVGNDDGLVYKFESKTKWEDEYNWVKLAGDKKVFSLMGSKNELWMLTYDKQYPHSWDDKKS